MSLYTSVHQSGTLAAGALMMYSTVIDTPNWVPLPGVKQTPEISNSISTVEDITIADKVKRYILGMSDGAELSIELTEYPDDTNQLAFITNAELKTPANMLLKIEFTSSVIYTFEVVVNGFSRPSQANEGINTVTINMKITGDITRVAAA